MNDNNTSEFVKVPIDQKARELYDKISNEMFNTRPWRIEDIGEDMAVASKATLKVVYKASIISPDSSICLYQRRENPVKLVKDFPSLKEKMTIYTIGR